MEKDVLLKIEHLQKKFIGSEPLKDVNCQIRRGEVISIIGPSGTGKSTFLRCINRLERPTGGKVYFHGEEITDNEEQIRHIRQKIGMVFQSFNLFSNMNVLENIITAPIMLKSMNKEEAVERAKQLLKMVGLSQKWQSYPDELSGGQQQRIAIIRALAMEPEIILFDEPTSALDPTMVGEVESVIKKVAQTGTTMMIVTHGMDFAKQISNRIFYMDEGGIYEEGTPQQIFDSPQKDRTRQFIKRLKVLELFIDSKEFDFLGSNTLIEEFALKNDIAPKLRNSLMSIVEEVVFQIILPELENPKIKILIEYAKLDESIDINIKYNGKRFNIDDTTNDIALAIVKGRVSNLKYEFVDGELANDLDLKLAMRNS